jgi:hypothetical protein
MSVEILIREAQSEGVGVTVSPEGKVQLSDGQSEREKWAGILKPRRGEVIRLLTMPAGVRAWRWRVSFTNRELLVSFTPEMSRDEVLGQYPGALTVELVPDTDLPGG